jgi:hypothetical protein
MGGNMPSHNLSRRLSELRTTRGQRLASAGLLAYFALQLGVPLALKLAPAGSVSTDFSWDMFSHRAECQALSASAILPSGQVKPLRLDRAFESSELRRMLYPERIQHFASFVCAQLSARHGSGVQLFLRAECRYTREGKAVVIADGKRDYCVTS